MCVALPGKIIEMNDKTAVVDFGGNKVTVRTGLVDVKIGDHVLVHAGCVIQTVTVAEAENLQKMMKEMGGLS